jgi:BirA family biotin operon repressor/biotin-[acetyl-CoA-carboxylase] ligase
MQTAVHSFTILDSVDSTNNYAMGMIHDGVAKHGEAWFSYEQTQGKGRRGKGWKADEAKNIILSIAVAPHFLTVYQQFHLNVAVALAAFDLFSKYAGDECMIKWPNDIFWNDRKAGGILIENILPGQSWQWAVIGIGININQTQFDVHSVFKPVSLKQITGKEHDIVELAKELHMNVLKRYKQLQDGEFEKMLLEYNQYLFKKNEKVKLRKENAVFETTIKGVSGPGKLLTVDTIEREFDFDEVEWIK